MQSSQPAPSKATTGSQPQAAIGMNVINPTTNPSKQTQCEHQQKASRIRGGGAGKDCLIGMFSCFVCFECCEGCCDCVADIVCCPCEMCC